MKVLGLTLALAFSANCSFSGAPAQLGGDGDGDGDGDTQVDAGQNAVDAASPDAPTATGRLMVERTASPLDVSDAGFDLNDWSAVARHTIVFGASHKHIDEGYSEDASARFGAVHDDAFIYVIVEVTDDERFDADKIELYFDTSADMTGLYGSDDSYVTIDSTATWDPNGTAIRLEGTLSPGPANGDLTYAVKLEKALLGSGVSTGMIGFNISIWDDDNEAGDGGWTLWHEPSGAHCDSCCTDGEPHGEPWCDTTMLGEMLLAP